MLIYGYVQLVNEGMKAMECGRCKSRVSGREGSLV